MGYVQKAKVMDEAAMGRALVRVAFEIAEKNNGCEDLCVLGILRRGAVLAERIAQKLSKEDGQKVPVGSIDVAPYRDDVPPGERKKEDASNIPFDINNKTVVLVDDVLYTGRTVRAALAAVLARGRPKRIQLAVLIDRGHRELPIRPDYVGKNVPTSSKERVSVQVMEYDGDEKASIIIQEG